MHVAYLESERRAVANERTNEIPEVSGDEPDAHDTRGGELAQQRRNDRTPVDRKDRLRPAFGDRAQAAAFTGRHHDGIRDHETPSERNETNPRARSSTNNL